MSFGCRWLAEVLRGFASCVVERPDTGYLALGDDWPPACSAVPVPLSRPIIAAVVPQPLAELTLPVLDDAEFGAALAAVECFDEGCFGMTKARVCFSSERSCMRAEMRGRSRCLLFSRSVLMSIEVRSFDAVRSGVPDIAVVVVDDAVTVLRSKSGYCFLIWACSFALGPLGFGGVGFAGTTKRQRETESDS